MRTRDRTFSRIEGRASIGDIAEVSRLSWTEMWEMHSLFHTASPAFSYWEPGTIHALRTFAEDVLSDHPPIVTLDAGPNVHIHRSEIRNMRAGGAL